MAAALKWDALTDAATAAAYIGIDVPAANTQDETMLYALINGTSRAIRKYTKRILVPERTGPLQSDPVATGTTKVLDWNGTTMLKLDPWEARAITSVNILPAGFTTPIVLRTDIADYIPMPRAQTEEGTYLWLKLPVAASWRANLDDWPRGGFRPTTAGYAVNVTGDWGVAASKIPDDVVEAALITIDDDWNNPEGYASRASGEIQVVEVAASARSLAGWTTPFPPRAANLLEPYIRLSFGV